MAITHRARSHDLTIKELTMSLGKLGLAAALLASSLGTFWTTPASAGCQVCIEDLEGNKHCFNLCPYEAGPLVWPWPREAVVTSPIDIGPIARDLQSLLRSDSGTFVLQNAASKSLFIVDLKKATLTEVVSKEQAVAR
jgi:hypothetical protein